MQKRRRRGFIQWR